MLQESGANPMWISLTSYATRLRLTWAGSRDVRSACYEPIRAVGLIAILVFVFYPILLGVYGVSVGVGLLALGACLAATRGAWLWVILGAAIGYLPLWLELIGVMGNG